MHRLIKIRITRDYESLQERMRHWRERWFEFDKSAGSFRPAVDIYETSQGLVLRMELAGVAREDLSLTLCGQELVIRGQRRLFPPEGVNRFLHHEMSYGLFERRFLIPGAIDPAGLEARLADGLLEVFLPRPARTSRRIPVKEAE